MPGTTTDRLLRAALFVKGLDGATELLAGLALLAAGPRALDGLTRGVVGHHLLGSPDGAPAGRVLAGEAALGADRTFAVVYLTLHGLVKLGLVVALLREVRPAYPVAAAVLGVFGVYEVYLAVDRGSWGMWAAGGLDLLLTALVLREYRRLRSRRRRAGGTAPRGGRPPRR
ncbi:DUF2127 domain-containing protein [Geodermatophilus sp. SYSU D01045]